MQQDRELVLYGRDKELAAVGQLVEGMRSGRAGALVLAGEAGIGKTALLDAAAGNAGAQVLRVTGVESEAELPFAGLHALLRPALDEIGTLPEQQATALLGAFGMAKEAVADRFLVGLGLLSLIAELAEGRPVLLVVDDAQWLDRASADALVFAARRLHAERAAVLAAARDEPPGSGLPGLPELRVSRLDQVAAERLLAGKTPQGLSCQIQLSGKADRVLRAGMLAPPAGGARSPAGSAVQRGQGKLRRHAASAARVRWPQAVSSS